MLDLSALPCQSHFCRVPDGVTRTAASVSPVAPLPPATEKARTSPVALVLHYSRSPARMPSPCGTGICGFLRLPARQGPAAVVHDLSTRPQGLDRPSDECPSPDPMNGFRSSGAEQESVSHCIYLTSTWAPASYRALSSAWAASSLVTPCLTGLGAPSTKSLASLRPRFVAARTT